MTYETITLATDPRGVATLTLACRTSTTRWRPR